MKNYVYARTTVSAAIRAALAATVVAACALAVAPNAGAQTLSAPTAPDTITPPAPNSAYLLGKAAGTQGYICLPTSTGASWTVNGSRPEATLFTTVFGQPFQILTHFLSPNTNPNADAPNPLPAGNATWQSSLDSSKVWAQPVRSIPAGSDPSCPNIGSISCLLLQVIGTAAGPSGGKALSQTTWVQRLNTKGGVAPAEGCSMAADVGKLALVPYTSDYYFFRKVW